MIVRPATPSDAPACAAIVRAWIEATPWMPGGPSREALEGVLGAAFDAGSGRACWVAEQDGAVAGYLSLEPSEGAGHVWGLYAARPGRGAGRALLDRAKAGRQRLTLHSHEPNAAAHRFYEREGFAVVERGRPGSDGVPELRMEWRA